MGCGSTKRKGDISDPATKEKRTEPGIYLVRNAPSVHDYWSKTYSEKARREKAPGPEQDPDYKYLEELNTHWNTKLVDPGLHKDGAKRAMEAVKNVNSMNVMHVFVSPLKRSLETCRAMLENHPNKANMKVFVHPLLRPFLNSTEDIPNKTLSELKKEYEKIESPKFDFSLLEMEENLGDLWFLNTLNSPDKETLLDQIKNSKEDYTKVVMDFMLKKKKENPKPQRPVETFENMRRRVVSFSEKLSRHISLAAVKPEEDVLIFTHGPVMLYLMALYWGPDGRALGQKANRCEPVEFNFHKLLESEKQFASNKAVKTRLTVQLMPGQVPKGVEEKGVTLIPMITCTKGHQLFFSKSDEEKPTYNCVKCLKGYKCSEGRWNCIFCKYNLCSSCKVAPAADALKKLCANGHSLEENEICDECPEKFSCSRCKKEGATPKDKKRLCCIGCSYDVCPNCA